MVGMIASEQAEAIRELARQVGCVAEELNRANQLQLQRLFGEQLDRAIDDPSLAEALSTLTGVSADRLGQLIFANKHYALILRSYRVGDIDRGELLGHLKVLSKSPVFREYWQLASDGRSSLPEDSLEARIGRAVAAVIEERLDDLDEWWVVGPAPEVRHEMSSVRVVGRLGDSPDHRGSGTMETCPDLFELSDGSFAVIGTDRTKELDPLLPADAARADYERIVVITRDTLLRAKRDIPEV